MARRASVHDVARLAEVSIGTVSNYLNGTVPVSPVTQTRIENAIQQLGYRRNQIAASLRRAQTNAIGVLLPNILNPYYTALFDGIEKEAQRCGFAVTLAITDGNEAKLRRNLDSLRSRQMDGIIIDGYFSTPFASMLRTVDLPLVMIEPPVGLTGYSAVKIDNVAASRQATSYLLRSGHSRIALVVPVRRDQRFVGYEEAYCQHGLDLDDSLIYECGPYESDLIAQGRRSMEHLLAQTDFTACFFTSDMLAIGGMSVLKERGIRVPQDVALIGFDDIPFARFADPALTTMSQPQHEMGRAAIELLLKAIEERDKREPVERIFECQLIVRGSA